MMISQEFKGFISKLKGKEKELDFDQESHVLFNKEEEPITHKSFLQQSFRKTYTSSAFLDRGTLGADLKNEDSNDVLHDFLKSILKTLPIDWTVPKLKYTNHPASVHLDTKTVRIHYLFQMLGVSVIFIVTDNSRLYGKITREEFINLRYRKDLVNKARKIQMHEGVF